MKTPVIIAAYNEAEHIGSTLRRLDKADVEPIVVVNGEVGAFETLAEAKKYTSNVHFSAEQGKMPAIQHALRTLYNQDEEATRSPLIFLDADSKPVFPGKWHEAMAGAVAGGETKVAAGTFLYDSKNPLVFAYRGFRSMQTAQRAADNHTLVATYGRNMAANFAGDLELFDEILEAEHIWPGEDRYLATKIGGEGLRSFVQLTGAESAVLTSSRYEAPIGYRFFIRGQNIEDVMLNRYANRRAEGVTHYYEWATNELVPYEDEEAA